jgi:hypothetical protein
MARSRDWLEERQAYLLSELKRGNLHSKEVRDRLRGRFDECKTMNDKALRKMAERDLAALIEEGKISKDEEGYYFVPFQRTFKSRGDLIQHLKHSKWMIVNILLDASSGAPDSVKRDIERHPEHFHWAPTGVVNYLIENVSLSLGDKINEPSDIGHQVGSDTITRSWIYHLRTAYFEVHRLLMNEIYLISKHACSEKKISNVVHFLDFPTPMRADEKLQWLKPLQLVKPPELGDDYTEVVNTYYELVGRFARILSQVYNGTPLFGSCEFCPRFEIGPS